MKTIRPILQACKVVRELLYQAITATSLMLKPARRNLAAFTVMALLLTPIAGCEKDEISPLNSSKYIELNNAMHLLWTDHMNWTYATVKAYFHDQESLQPTLERLLQNQQDIGAAIVPYYGQAAGDALASLLTTHIEQAVPVLQAAQAGDQAALDIALSNWHANAKEIANFLSAANPENWPTLELEGMMMHHINTTVTYSVDLLEGDFQGSIENYQHAYDHMMEMAEKLSQGIALQFPDRF
jgi:hypothetical protein